MSAVFLPSRLSGAVVAPPSKSVAHRAVLCAALADGQSAVRHLAMSDDIAATLSAVRAFGAAVGGEGDERTICGARGFDRATVDCAESGSTLRFCIPIAAALTDGTCRFVGRGRLGARPLGEYEKIWKERGLFWQNSSEGGALDLTVGGRLRGGVFEMRGDVSSQFFSGILFALPLVGGELRATTPLASRAYIDMTIETMRGFGVSVEERDGVFRADGKYGPRDFTVEGDWSQAAFFAVANYAGSNVEIRGLKEDSLQGDRAIVPMLERLKGEGDLVFDGEQCPDIMPVFSLACALREGRRTRLVGLERLKIKECDRLAATYEMLKTLGADIVRDGDELTIKGRARLRGGKVTSCGDHRMAMTAAIAALACEGEVEVDDVGCMSKSYPDFLQQYTRLGGRVQ